MLPKALVSVIDALGMLPGVGQKTAERYAYYLFRANPKVAEEISAALSSLHSGVKSCPVTFALIDADEEVSPLYSDPTRDKSTVLVVEEPLDIYAIEATFIMCWVGRFRRLMGLRRISCIYASWWNG